MKKPSTTHPEVRLAKKPTPALTLWTPDAFRTHLSTLYPSGLALSAALGMSRPIGCAILRGSQVPSSRALEALGYEWVIRRKP